MGKTLDEFYSIVEQDKVFRNLASAELVGCIALVAALDMSDKTWATKIWLLGAILLFISCLFSIIRFSLRYEMRYKLLEENGESIVKEYSKRISKFAEDGPVKTARIEVLAESALLLAKIESEEISEEEKRKKFESELDKKIKELEAHKKTGSINKGSEGYVGDVLSSYLKNLEADSRAGFIKFIKRPLDEKNKKLRWAMDVLSVYTKRKAFYTANIFLAIAVAFLLS